MARTLTVQITLGEYKYCAEIVEAGMFWGHGYSPIAALGALEDHLRELVELVPLALKAVELKQAALAQEEAKAK